MTLILPISLLLFSGFVSASLYPTCPIAKTVYRGGTWNNITWIDSEESPPLDQLGNMSIHLWVDDTVELVTLATEVDPRKLSQNVFIPENLWKDSSNFDIRFKSTDPPVIIYTAYFTITGMKGNGSSDSNSDSELGSSTPSSSSDDAPSSSTVPSVPDGGNNDMVTVTMEMLDSNTVPFPSSTTATSGPTGTTTTATGAGAGAVGAMANDASSGGRHVRKSSMKFNVVFVIFPALFGVALAL